MHPTHHHPSERTGMSWACRAQMCAWRASTSGRRGVHDYVRTRSDAGVLARLPLRAGVTFGAEMSRGNRARQEDALAVKCVSLPCEELRKDLALRAPHGATRDPWYGWSCEQAGGADLGSQVVWFGVYDGHGGPAVSSLLRDKLHRVFEQAQPDMIADTGTHDGLT